MQRIFSLALAFAFGASAFAAGNDELWEVTSQMNMPGMPAGMGAQKRQEFTEKGGRAKAKGTRRSGKCKKNDTKQPGPTDTSTIDLPAGTPTHRHTYNARD